METLTERQKRYYADVRNYRSQIVLATLEDGIYAWCKFNPDNKIKMEIDEGQDDEDNIWCGIPMTWGYIVPNHYIDVLINKKTKRGTLYITRLDGHIPHVLDECSFKPQRWVELN